MIKLIIIFGLILVILCAEPEVPGIFDCVYKCPDFKTTTPNPNNTAFIDGCGDHSFIVPEHLLPNPEFITCCNDHDICYETCNKSKENCDQIFKDCMMKSCGNNWSCRIVADSFYGTVSLFGCPSYIVNQERACLCV